MRIKAKADRGVAGLTILLSVVTMLFVIGLLVMIFSLMGGEMQDATYTSTAVTVNNESGGFLNGTLFTVDNADARNFASFVVVNVYNSTNATGLVPASNYTVGSAGTLINSSAQVWPTINVSYTYTWDANNTATDVMFDTTIGVASVTDWFDIFVVIVAMVVLILLTVIIITAIRGSGLMSGGSA